MPRQGETEVRRAQLIAPFGVGAMVVSRDGVSMICAGLDDWFVHDADSRRSLDVEEFNVHEWRLERYLRVNHFRLPPDYREPHPGQDNTNVKLRVPAWRFPLWHWCPKCKRLQEFGRAQREPSLCKHCSEGEEKRWKTRMVQVRFVAMCEHGHLQDFPWREWVHGNRDTICDGQLYLKSLRGLGLGSLRVECSCGEKRSLAGITRPLKSFLCRGHRPWLGDAEPESCGLPLRGTLRNATNVYFADVRSAIYLPRGGAVVPDELVALFEQPPLSTVVSILRDTSVLRVPSLRGTKYSGLLQEYTDQQIEAAIRIFQGERVHDAPLDENIPEDRIEEELRRGEFLVLRQSQASSELRVKLCQVEEYQQGIFPVATYFTLLSLIPKLRETRALAGFSRVVPENGLGLETRKRMLWREMPTGDEAWLPATVVYGEGLYLELNDVRLRSWESIKEVRERAEALERRYRKVQQDRKLRDRSITPRLLLIHTLAHLIINQLTFECGYSTASLRERLYISDGSTGTSMAGLLIYTAAGDSEGTLGGLVRMGTPGNLERVLRNAIEGARWCSADPICLELGWRGQGPDSCNGAACHNCSLIPETSCELFNRFLDRSMLIGDQESGLVGFFSSLTL